MTEKNTWIHVYDALPLALRLHGLIFRNQVNAPASDSGGCDGINCQRRFSAYRNDSSGQAKNDQSKIDCLVDKANVDKCQHGSSLVCSVDQLGQLIQSTTPCKVAAPANRGNVERLGVIAVVVLDCSASTVSAGHTTRVLQLAFSDGCCNHVMRLALGCTGRHNLNPCFRDLVHTQNPVETTRLGFQCPACQLFNLQLTGIGWGNAPLTNRALVAAKSSSDFGLRSVVLSDFKCFHVRYYEPSNMGCLIYFYMALLCCD